MPKSFARTSRVAEVIQTAIAQYLPLHYVDRRMALVTVTGVKVSPDYSLAQVFVSVLSDDDQEIADVIAMLNADKKAFRHELAQRVNMRTTPEICFRFDESVRYGAHMSQLLNRLVDDES